MASPLSPSTGSSLNRTATPPSAKRSRETFEAPTYTMDPNMSEDDTSSPFISCTVDACDSDNVSPAKTKHARVLSGNKPSPLKMLSETGTANGSMRMSMGGANDENTPPRGTRSPRKMSPEKRFPIKISDPSKTPKSVWDANQVMQTHERTINIEQALRENEGLTKAIEIFEDEQSLLEDEPDVNTTKGDGPKEAAPEPEADEAAGLDDTMISTFSTFSAVPNMTMLARLGHSPTKTGGTTPRPSKTEHSVRPESSMRDSGGSTNLLDFTEQFRFPARHSLTRGSLSPTRTVGAVGATPNRQLTNLIDFDIPPMPTPRSLPSISARELESLKSNFLSEISSLKASLSGKEAEVNSLKTAVGDAEKRVGESLEQLREIRADKETLAAEKEGWESRGRDMESVLHQVKAEIVNSQQDREELEQKLEESEKRREAAEIMHQEAESKIAGMRAGKESPQKPKSSSNTDVDVAKEVEIAVERVARELHTLYKSKHETKVSALKKSYETKWEKKISSLESALASLTSENSKLRSSQDATMIMEASVLEVGENEKKERKAQAVKDSAAIKELNAEIRKLEAVIETVKCDNEDLRGLLEKERVEKGELVSLAEEMMSMQSFVGQTPRPTNQAEVSRPGLQTSRTPAPIREAVSAIQEPRRDSIARTPNVRSSGLRAPGTGLRSSHERTKSGGGLPRPGGVARSGIMSSIEKMGNHRGRAAD